MTMDIYVRKHEITIEKKNNEKLRQANIKESCDKEVTTIVH